MKIKSKRKSLGFARFSAAVRLAGGSDLTCATAGKPDCYRGSSEIQNLRSRQRSHVLLILLFIRDGSDAAERDLGAGRTQVALRGPSGMDAARAAPPPWMADGGGPTERRRSEGISTKSRPNQEQRHLVTWCLFKSLAEGETALALARAGTDDAGASDTTAADRAIHRKSQCAPAALFKSLSAHSV